MSRERLEEIRQRLVLLHSAVDVDDETKNYIFKDLKVEWLIERVQELEQDVREWEIVNEQWEKINTQIAEQNKRYRETIKRALQAPKEHGLSAGLVIKCMTQELEEALEESQCK